MQWLLWLYIYSSLITNHHAYTLIYMHHCHHHHHYIYISPDIWLFLAISVRLTNPPIDSGRPVYTYKYWFVTHYYYYSISMTYMIIMTHSDEVVVTTITIYSSLITNHHSYTLIYIHHCHPPHYIYITWYLIILNTQPLQINQSTDRLW